MADVNATDGSYPGATRYGSCDLGGTGVTLVAALRGGVFEITNTAGLGSLATIRYDVSTLEDVLGALVMSANVTIYEPLPPHAHDDGRYVPLATIPLPAALDGETEWRVPGHALFGAHPALLTVRIQAPSGSILEMHRLDVLQVALPTGEVPIDPPYRVFLQTWFPDW